MTLHPHYFRLRQGMSLVELVVVLALLGVLYATVSASIPAGVRDPGITTRTLLDARRSAIREGRIVTRAWDDAGRTHRVTAFPTGLVLADTGRGTFLATERADAAAR